MDDYPRRRRPRAARERQDFAIEDLRAQFGEVEVEQRYRSFAIVTYHTPSGCKITKEIKT